MLVERRLLTPALLLLLAAFACHHEKQPEKVRKPLGPTYRVDDFMRAPSVVWRQQPDVSQCRRSTFSGVLIAEAVIDDSGLVRSVKMLRGSGDSCIDEAALDAMKEWRFRPATREHKPVSSVFTLTVAIQRPR